ncbi:hypothetical protein [Streptomyces sp. NPDC001502]|uniref:hypothetical protein n=1 Tax=Streptomyces sp. NPDC001502 TaxID=3364578 RepID=UPI0036B0BF70
MTDRYRDLAPAEAVHALPDQGAADRVAPADSSRAALDKARAGGWTCVIVTNGPHCPAGSQDPPLRTRPARPGLGDF